MPVMSSTSLDILRHIEVNGPRTRTELGKALHHLRIPEGTVANLTHLGYLVPDRTTTPISYALSNKARIKLQSPNTPKVRKTPTKRTANTLSDWPETQQQARGLPAPPPYRPTTKPKGYQPTEYHPSTRPGAMQACALPSRMGNTLHYRDGRVTDMAGNLVNT